MVLLEALLAMFLVLEILSVRFPALHDFFINKAITIHVQVFQKVKFAVAVYWQLSVSLVLARTIPLQI